MEIEVSGIIGSKLNAEVPMHDLFFVFSGGGVGGRQGAAGREQLRRDGTEAERSRVQVEHAVPVDDHPDGPTDYLPEVDQVSQVLLWLTGTGKKLLPFICFHYRDLSWRLFGACFWLSHAFALLIMSSFPH